MSMLKKILITVTGILLILGLLGGSLTLLKFLPFLTLGILIWVNEREKKDVRFWIVLISLIMSVINLSIPALADVILWVLLMIAWWK